MIILKKTHNRYSLKSGQANSILRFGKYGIKVITFGRLTKEQLESILWILLKKLKFLSNNKKTFKFWNLLILNSTLTKLSSESRMGKGKGAIYTTALFIKPGTIIFEFDNISMYQMLNIFKFMQKLLPFTISLQKNYI
uniref:Ribosomal protein L16 n=1 Tax=Schizymenia dubyi TaxID=38368 RepID=A0A0E3DBD2_9FLOR|nr:ribosomal protein L16 [Schizymenia dubyi]